VLSSGESGGQEVVGSVLGESSEGYDVSPRSVEVGPRFESTNAWKGQEGTFDDDFVGDIQLGPILEPSFSNKPVEIGQVADLGKGEVVGQSMLPMDGKRAFNDVCRAAGHMSEKVGTNKKLVGEVCAEVACRSPNPILEVNGLAADGLGCGPFFLAGSDLTYHDESCSFNLVPGANGSGSATVVPET
jgi:hypothetical protein